MDTQILKNRLNALKGTIIPVLNKWGINQLGTAEFLKADNFINNEDFTITVKLLDTKKSKNEVVEFTAGFYDNFNGVVGCNDKLNYSLVFENI